MREKILLVEDDHIMVDLLKTVLGMEGYQVVAMLDKKGDIIPNIKTEKPNLVIMDVFLGDRNGLDIIQLIRNEPELHNIKIIMVSGMEKKKECLEAGADAFLLKPYMPDELFTILQENSLKAQ
jgi:DNA-binding response OmpR family regulator